MPVFNVAIVAFDQRHESGIREVRHTVFTHEQGVDPMIEFDGLDTSAVHAIVFTEDETVVATGRLLDDGHIGRIAVLTGFRSNGLGKKIVLALIAEAKKNGFNRVYLNAQTQAIPFYQKLGFSTYGGEFMDANIPHIGMEKYLH